MAIGKQDEPREQEELADEPAQTGLGPVSQSEAQTSSAQAGAFPIVAIGASAGGLEALQAFFSKVPADCGIGFVVLTHLRPGRESLMPELLANVSHLPVLPSGDRTLVKPGTIIVAMDPQMTISHGMLQPVSPEGDLHHPIDSFFRDLATDQQQNAIAIILSGSGNDGAQGLRAIKASGGMVMAQDPSSAKYASMPDAAHATGLVDYVLAPQEMPAALLQYCLGPYLKPGAKFERPLLPDDAIQGILVRLRAHTGQDFTCYKKSTVSRRIERRMNLHRMESPQDYLRFLRENTHEMDMLQQELLISVTSFFRDPDSFLALAEKGLTALLSDRPEGRVIRVWVPGCATGEEAYSIAILLKEQMRSMDLFHEVQIFATDLDKRAIRTARSGLYPESIAADVSPERLQQFFSRENAGYRIHKIIRDMIVFAIQNVISDPPFTRMDLILCRNLLIYLDGTTQQRVLSAFHHALQPGGLLFLGSSETPGESAQYFESIDGKHKVLRRREMTGIRPMITLPAKHAKEPATGSWDGASTPAGTPIGKIIERMLLEEFVPCSIVVDDRDTAIYIHGRSGQYLEPEQGLPRNNLQQMAREGLGPALATVLREARQSQEESIRHGIAVRTNGHFTRVDLSARLLSTPEALRGLRLITIRPSPDSAEQKFPPELPALNDSGVRSELERELEHTRENLQSTIEELETANEELKSSNEELQSANEELQSTNEELETSKEEMQSLNEELNTVNAELQSKINALASTNDDMNNLLNSMHIATIFLDGQLRVRRYTEQARDLVRLIGSDIGRPLSDLTSSLDYPDLVDDCRQVLATLISMEKEIEDSQHGWYLVRLMPYRTAENLIDGIVMTIVDIDRMKQIERRAALERDYFEAIVQTVREPLIVLDGDLRVISANDSFYGTFLMSPKHTEGRLLYKLGDRQWENPSLKELLERVLPSHEAMTDIPVELEIPSRGLRSFLLNARAVRSNERGAGLILLAFEDRN